MSNEEIYQKLIEWLDNPIFGFTESEWLMPMITSYLTPEEAEFLTGFPMQEKSLEELADLKDMDPEELHAKIKEYCAKGILFESIRGDSISYRLLDAMQIFIRMPYWPGEEKEPLKTMTPYANKYYMDGWYDQMDAVTHKGLRSIPISETIDDKKQILPFEDILQVVDNFDYYTVSHCPCRMRHKLDPDYIDSQYPSEVCLHFGELGRYCVENGMGREITREETFQILKKAADAGLVHGISNYEDNPDTICNCDPQYCTMFKPYHQLGHKKSMDASNYKVKVTPKTCRACGLCAKRCPMDAIQFKVSLEAPNKFGKAVEVDTEKCVGCGVCVHNCPPKSIMLEHRKETTRSPKTSDEYNQLFVADRLAAIEKQA